MVVEDQGNKIWIYLSCLTILFISTTYNFFVSGPILNILKLNSNLLVFVFVALIFSIFFLILVLLKKKDFHNLLIIYYNKLNKKFLRYVLFVLLGGISFLFFQLMYLKHSTNLISLILFNSGKLLVAVLFIYSITNQYNLKNHQNQLLFSFICSSGLLLFVGMLFKFFMPQLSPILSSIGTRTILVLPIFASIFIAIMFKKKISKYTNSLFSLILIFLLVASNLLLILNPTIFSQTNNLPPYDFNQKEIMSIDYVSFQIPLDKFIFTSFRYNFLLNYDNSKEFKNKIISNNNFDEEGYYIFTKIMGKYGVLQEEKTMGKQAPISIIIDPNKDLIYNNDEVKIYN